TAKTSTIRARTLKPTDRLRCSAAVRSRESRLAMKTHQQPTSKGPARSRLALAGLLAVAGAVSGCSLQREYQCRQWQREGLVVSTLSACMECVDQFGSNPESVQGCAVGMDAASLIERHSER